VLGSEGTRKQQHLRQQQNQPQGPSANGTPQDDGTTKTKGDLAIALLTFRSGSCLLSVLSEVEGTCGCSWLLSARQEDIAVEAQVESLALVQANVASGQEADSGSQASADAGSDGGSFASTSGCSGEGA